MRQSTRRALVDELASCIEKGGSVLGPTPENAISSGSISETKQIELEKNANPLDALITYLITEGRTPLQASDLGRAVVDEARKSGVGVDLGSYPAMAVLDDRQIYGPPNMRPSVAAHELGHLTGSTSKWLHKLGPLRNPTVLGGLALGAAAASGLPEAIARSGADDETRNRAMVALQALGAAAAGAQLPVLAEEMRASGRALRYLYRLGGLKSAVRGAPALAAAGATYATQSLPGAWLIADAQSEKAEKRASVVVPKPIQLRQADEILSEERPTQDQWLKFQDRLRRSKGYREAVLLHPNADAKLKRHVRAMAKLHAGQHVRKVTSDTGKKRYQLKLMSTGRVGCTCPDWRYRKSHGGGDCKHVRRFRKAFDTGQKPRGYKTVLEKKADVVMKVASTRALRELLQLATKEGPGAAWRTGRGWQRRDALRRFRNPELKELGPGTEAGGRFSKVTPFETRQELMTGRKGGLGELGHRMSEEQAEGLFTRWAKQTGIADRLQAARAAGDDATARELNERMFRAWNRVSPGGRTVRDLDPMMERQGVRAALGDDPVVASGYLKEGPRHLTAWDRSMMRVPADVRGTYPKERPRMGELLAAGMEGGHLPKVDIGDTSAIRPHVVKKTVPHFDDLVRAFSLRAGFRKKDSGFDSLPGALVRKKVE